MDSRVCMGPDSWRGGRAGESKKRNNVIILRSELCRRLPAGAPGTSRAALGRRHKPTVLSKELVMAELKRLCEPDEDGDEATTIDAVIASIKAFFPHLMVPQDAVEKVEGFIKQLAADQVLVIVRGGLCLI